MRSLTLTATQLLLVSLVTLACGKVKRIGEPSGDGDATTVSEPGDGDGDGDTTSGAGGSEGDGDTAAPSDGVNYGSPELSGFVRLTHSQWANTIRDIFELVDLPDTSTFQDDPPLGTFSNNEKKLYVGEVEWLDHQKGAETIAELVASDEGTLAQLGGVDDATSFITRLGKRAFRRSLSSNEVARFEQIWAEGAQNTEHHSVGSAAANGARVFLEALLQSPHFLYRIELSAEGMRLSGLELATKLSLLLMDTTPSDDLLEAAESGELDTNEGLVQIAVNMLSGDEAAASMVRFYSEHYWLDRYAWIDKDTAIFPDYTDQFNQSVFDADQLFFAHIYATESGLRQTLRSPTAFVDALTARYYKVESPASGFEQVDLEGRSGLLTRLGFLASNASYTRPDPISRGLFIFARILCSPVELISGHPEVIPIQPDPALTNREWLEAYNSAAVCTGCHAGYLDPLGFAFESYDAIGQSRETDNGKPVNTEAGYDFGDGYKSFADAEELIALLAEEPAAHACFSSQLAEFVFARDLKEDDASTLRRAQSLSETADASTQEITLALIESPHFTNARSAE